MGISILAVWLATVPWLQAPEFPHAFPRAGAVQLIDNDRVTMWDVTWIKGKPSPMHRHLYDLVGVYLVGSSIRVTPLSGAARESTVDPGFILYQREGVTHIEEGTADIPRHAILTDIKGGPIPPLPNTSGQPAAFPRVGARQAVDNEKVTIWGYTWVLGKPSGMHFHDKDAVIVFLGDGELKSTTPDGKSQITRIKRGESRFSPRGSLHNEELLSGNLSAVVAELK